MKIEITENFKKTLMIKDSADCSIKDINFLNEEEAKMRNVNVEVLFNGDIVPIMNGFKTNRIFGDYNTIFKNLSVDLVAFCHSYNTKDDFNPDECSDGDLKFKVNLWWLLNKLNGDEKFFPMGYDSFAVSTVEDLFTWSDIYTHEEGSKIYSEALAEGFLIGKPEVNGCKYCK